MHVWRVYPNSQASLANIWPLFIKAEKKVLDFIVLKNLIKAINR